MSDLMRWEGDAAPLNPESYCDMLRTLREQAEAGDIESVKEYRSALREVSYHKLLTDMDCDEYEPNPLEN